jgi:hypothetical protein
LINEKPWLSSIIRLALFIDKSLIPNKNEDNSVAMRYNYLQMHTVINNQIRIVLLLMMICVIILPLYAGYSVQQTYAREGFNGKSLSGRTILLLPLLTKAGFDSTGGLNPFKQLKWLKRERNDLIFTADRGFERRYIARCDSTSLPLFYMNLYNANNIAVQTSDSVWNAIPFPMVLTVRLKNAAHIKDFNSKSHRVLILEAELWSKDSAEVLWRAGITARVSGRRLNDEKFITRVFKELYAALPVAPYKESEDVDW